MTLATSLFSLFAFVTLLILSLQAQPYIQSPIAPINSRYVGGFPGVNPYGVYGGASGGSYPPMGLPYGGSTYPGNYATAGYGQQTTAKPSYAYFTGYGNQNALSGYEGPYGGYNTYWQPGVSYPPQGYGSSYNQGQQNYGSGFCKDRSSDCAMLASTGQCVNSLSTRNLCPVSCGTGCIGSESGEYSSGSAYGYGLAGPVYSAYPYSPLTGNTPLGYNGYSANSYGQTSTPFNGYQPSVSTLLPTAYVLPPIPNYAIPSSYSQGGYFPICKDSHIQGCQNWASLGYCQTVPEYMLIYCKATCGACNNLGGSIYGTYIQPSFGPTELNGAGYNQVFGSGLGSNLYSTDLLNGPIDASQLASFATLSPAASSYYANLLANNPNYQLTSTDLALLNSLSGADQTGLGSVFGGVNSGLGQGMSPSQFLPYNSGLYPYKSSIFSAEKKEPKAMALASNDLGISGGFGLGNPNDKTASNGQLSTVVRMDELAGA